MIREMEKKNCCGCTACFSICPNSCIRLVRDSEGFCYPEVDLEKCIKCNLCNQVCPSLNKPVIDQGWIRKGYIVRAKKREILMNSTSGGFFIPLGKWVLNQGGYVVGASINNNKEVVHIIAKNHKELATLSGSKYVQSKMEGIFKAIKELLVENNLVCFSGTPCQVSGLRNYLNREYDNLILVDVVCHGTPSPVLWEKYVNEQERRYDSKIKHVRFRSKAWGFHSGTMELEFENGKIYRKSSRTDPMLVCFFAEISSRPSCYECKFKQIERVSDFTMYDCWHPEKLNDDRKDDDLGWSNIIVQSKKGMEIFKQIKKYYLWHEININKAVKLDGIMAEYSAQAHSKRDEFYTEIQKYTLKQIIKKYGLVSGKDKFIDIIKPLLYKIGILNIIRKLKNKSGLVIRTLVK